MAVAEGESDAQLAACAEYALEGMPMDALLELCRMLVPTWTPVKGS